MKKFLRNCWEWVIPYFTLKMIPFLAVAWFITNGWSYAAIIVGNQYDIAWLKWVGTAWVGLLWFPFTIEKPITIFIAALLYKLFYRKAYVKPEDIVSANSTLLEQHNEKDKE